ncbi:8-oxo-dGDP phosphatase NUDT18-like [Stegodyphus dumicola]|uniref:8-oxo-dGDP phosphatase NUDT18-like n=1 Tax=Stegodyphus dumicola TaxID=202533 RepID=UPI0015B12A6D|nr:8-oxo-dGDP phosphatase NUDT18-like [Stegodyphus dumicola]
MADRLEAGIENILSGLAVEDESTTVLDYTLADQTQDLVLRGLDAPSFADYKPVLRETVSYIVASVLINSNNEVLMMQEAKSSCAGTWYIPAGRVEPGENLIEAAKREVLEETGLQFEPTTLLMVECAQGHWFRFVFTGNVTGGLLKTVARADAESLQASWIDDLNQLSLRGEDILPLIERTKEFHAAKPEAWHRPLLPAVHPHKHLIIRLIVVIRKKSNNRIHVLISEKGGVHFPTCEINPCKSIHSTMQKYIQILFGAKPPPHKPHGILSVEHCAGVSAEHDGLCMTILISCKSALEDVAVSSNYAWLEIRKDLGERLVERVKKNKCVYLNVLR